MSKTILCLCFSCLLVLPHNNWELLRDEDRIKLYTRKVTGSKIKEVKAETTFNAPLEDLEIIFRNVEGYKQWFDECLVSEQLAEIDTNNVYGRFVIRVPFPFQNRDVVAKLNFKKVDAQTFQVTLTNKPNYIPKKRRLIRTPHFESKWTFKSMDNNTKTKTVMTLHANMGGYIPTWAINSATKWGPFLSIKKLRNLVETE